MKILVVVPSLGRGGAERTVSRLTLEWARTGHAVTVAVFDGAAPAYPFGGRLADLGAPARSGGFLNPLRRVLGLRRLMRDLDPDRIFAFTESANIPAIVAALSCGRRQKVTLSVRGNPDRMRWFHKALASRLYGYAARIVAVSQGVADRLERDLPACRGKLSVLYSPTLEAAAEAGEEETDRNPFFFAAGRLVPGKGFARMVRIFAAADCPDAVLRIAGDGPERGNLEALIRELGLDARVRLLGGLEHPFADGEGARAFLLASEHEGFPVVLIEAMAYGLPVVAFDCDFGPREALRDGVEGFLVPPGDEGGFARSMERLCADLELRREMGRAARRRAGDFRAETVAARWLEPFPGDFA